MDTLRYPGSFQTILLDIWGSSDTDVYAVGASSNDVGQMYHYDGRDWKPVRLSVAEGGRIDGLFDLFSIYGFQRDNIYAVGTREYPNSHPPPNFLDSSLIIHYDGAKWEQIAIEPRGLWLTALWGSQPDDIWAGGRLGTLYHFDGKNWQKTAFDTSIQLTAIFGFSGSDVYATGWKDASVVTSIDSFQYFLYHYDGAAWAGIDSFKEHSLLEWDKFGYLGLWGSPEGALYSVSTFVFKKEATSWKPVVTSSAFPFFAIHGSAGNNIFAVGMFSEVYHYNGIDWYWFRQLYNTKRDCSGVWNTDKEVFIVASDANQSYIIHGY